MAEANLTTRALAAALKELTQEQGFERVSVSDICEACGVSRKTFYYHFQDKYELAEWIFNTAFVAVLKKANPTGEWEIIDAACQYFYAERRFYSDLLKYDGQNAFRTYFYSLLFEALEEYILPDMSHVRSVAEDNGLPPDEAKDFFIHFFSDSLFVATFRWISTGARIPPDRFVSLLKSVSKLIEVRVYERSGMEEPKE